MSHTDDTVEPSPTATYTATLEADERPSECVIAAAATTSGRSVRELSPLYEAIEPDALDALFEHAGRPGYSSVPCVRFVYEGYDVRITLDEGDGSTGRVHLERRVLPDEDAEPE